MTNTMLLEELSPYCSSPGRIAREVGKDGTEQDSNPDNKNNDMKNKRTESYHHFQEIKLAFEDMVTSVRELLGIGV